MLKCLAISRVYQDCKPNSNDRNPSLLLISHTPSCVIPLRQHQPNHNRHDQSSTILPVPMQTSSPTTDQYSAPNPPNALPEPFPRPQAPRSGKSAIASAAPPPPPHYARDRSRAGARGYRARLRGASRRLRPSPDVLESTISNTPAVAARHRAV